LVHLATTIVHTSQYQDRFVGSGRLLLGKADVCGMAQGFRQRFLSSSSWNNGTSADTAEKKLIVDQLLTYEFHSVLLIWLHHARPSKKQITARSLPVLFVLNTKRAKKVKA